MSDSLYNSYDSQDSLDETSELIHESHHPDKSSKWKAEKALSLINDNSRPFHKSCRTLIYYPDLLKIYLTKVKYLHCDDFSAMISRCCEHKDEHVDEHEEVEESLDILIDLWQNKKDRLLLKQFNFESAIETNEWWQRNKYTREIVDEYSKEIDKDELCMPKYLPKKYKLNERLIEKAKKVGLIDKYYENFKEGKKIKYESPNIFSMEAYGLYYGYRHVYHLVLYGSREDKEILIKYWDLFEGGGEKDCKYEACCDCLDKPENTNNKEIRNLLLGIVESRRVGFDLL